LLKGKQFAIHIFACTEPAIVLGYAPRQRVYQDSLFHLGGLYQWRYSANLPIV
jgi:hypothetical protein